MVATFFPNYGGFDFILFVLDYFYIFLDCSYLFLNFI
jgi:hypothetical protein